MDEGAGEVGALLSGLLADGSTMVDAIAEIRGRGIRTFNLLGPLMAVAGLSETQAIQLVVRSGSLVRLLKGYTSEWITASECANGLLCEFLLHEWIDEEIPTHLDKFPEEVRVRFVELLQEARDSNFTWVRGGVGSGGPSAVDPAKCCRVCVLFDVV